MPNFVIREAITADMPTILSIYANEVLHGLATFEDTEPTLQEMLLRRKVILDLGFPYLVAERAGKIVGYSYASTHRPRPAYRYSVENSVYVDKNHRGKGVGCALLENLIEICEKSGFMQMVAVIGDSQNTGSIALHKSLGFREVGMLYSVGFKFDRWVDTTIMQRALGTGSGICVAKF